MNSKSSYQNTLWLRFNGFTTMELVIAVLLVSTIFAVLFNAVGKQNNRAKNTVEEIQALGLAKRVAQAVRNEIESADVIIKPSPGKSMPFCLLLSSAQSAVLLGSDSDASLFKANHKGKKTLISAQNGSLKLDYFRFSRQLDGTLELYLKFKTAKEDSYVLEFFDIF
jgi:type II secretory pathway pseudopilin PulG